MQHRSKFPQSWTIPWVAVSSSFLLSAMPCGPCCDRRTADVLLIYKWPNSVWFHCLNIASLLLLPRWLQMDKDSCNYILHPCSYNVVCYPGSHPVPWFLNVRASGSSDTAWAPHSVIYICTILADTTSDSFYHAVQPPVQPGGEKEKEVVCCKRCKHNFPISFDPDPSPLWQTQAVMLTAIPISKASDSCKESLNWLLFTALPSEIGLAEACVGRSRRYLGICSLRDPAAPCPILCGTSVLGKWTSNH